MQTIYVNGKFVAQATTGVQRVARCLLSALDRLIAEEGTPWRWVLLCPPGHSVPQLSAIRVETIGKAALGLHAWEQIALPRAARDGLLVNLAGSAPAFAGPQVCTFHDAAVFDRPDTYSRPFGIWYRWLFRRLAQRAASVVTVSAFSRERLARHLAISLDRIVVVPNGADHLHGIRADAGMLADAGLATKPFFLAVGSDSSNKNHARVASALSASGQNGTALVIVGGGRGSVFATEGASGRVTGHHVLHLGRVDDRTLKSLYESSIALVFPSFYEGSGLPPLEAMNCGCPVIASRSGALAETCGDAALFVDPTSVPDIAAAIDLLAADNSYRRDFIARGRAHAAGQTWRRAAERWHALLYAHVSAVV